ncbi:BC1881 family protein [Priestia megaterium]|nr:BC1881 family protein [Priestia megaterium]
MGKYGEPVFEQDVKSIPTVALHEELAKRAGVKEVSLNHNEETMLVGAKVEGPARILINKD